MGFGVVAVHVCLPSSRDGAALHRSDHFMGRRSQTGREPRGGRWGFFLHLLLPVDKYQPAKVLKADVELVAPTDLPPVRGMDIVCGRRGQAASAPRCQHPDHPTPAAAIPAQAWD